MSTRPSASPAPLPGETEPRPPQPASEGQPGPGREPPRWLLVRGLLPRDFVVGAGLGGLLAVSAFTPNDRVLSLGIAVAVALLYVGVRFGQRRRAPALGAPRSAQPRGLLLRVPAAVWGALGILAVALTPTALWLYRSWTVTVWNNAHGILIPPAMAFIAWSVLRRDRDASARSSPWGFACVVPGLLLVCVDAVLRTHQLAALGFVLMLPGLSLLLLGSARTSRLRIPLLLALLMVPVPMALAGSIHLKELTASAVAPLVASFGIPVLREHIFLHLPRASFLVADACSGFGALYAAVGLSVVLAASARSPGRKLLILAAAPLLAIGCNVVRVALLVLLAHFFGLGLLDTRFHEASGVATFGAVLVLLFAIADRRSLRESYL